MADKTALAARPTADARSPPASVYPVSYTHLDVYKRQHGTNDNTGNSGLYNGSGAHGTGLQRDIQRTILQPPVSLFFACLLYTSPAQTELIQSLQKTLEAGRLEKENLRQQIEYLTKKLFGTSSEKRKDIDGDVYKRQMNYS